MDGNRRIQKMKKKDQKQKQEIQDYRELAKAKWMSKQRGNPKKKKKKNNRSYKKKRKSNEGSGIGGIFSGIFGKKNNGKQKSKPKRKKASVSEPKNLPNVRTIADYREDPNIKKSG